ncbi:histone deacetylase family protein [Nordella sp. HKS 07]|uniref:histone deacetylase family protein n=1 Tax=Nordella sp. HKS 07 TaxID=2712222 RepID=UPI0013E1C51D|nr:histone deacetylase family protein [Nordella sp. HKS 07]QIG50347.1 histone deacetylase family protein [Nordella sp. HKS 07]
MITVFDDIQRLHNPPSFIVAGKAQPIPERPERIDILLEGVKSSGGVVVAPKSVGNETLSLVHDTRYLAFMDGLWQRWHRQPNAAEYPAPNIHALGRPSLAPVGYPDSVVGQCGYHLGDGSCPFMDKTWDAAKASAASAVHAARLIRDGERFVYALCRPPGHHAASDVAAGFCYINNSALAAEVLNRAGRRVAILDIDVHHGNGTEAIFYDRADVLTVSIHADPRRFYPFFWGYAEETGRGEGEGFNLNLPLPRGTRIDAYRTALAQALRRVGEFGPEILVVAAGLDISIDDPFQGFAIETKDFAVIGRDIADLKLPLLVVQEGGYPSPSLGANLASLLEGLRA